MALGVFGYMGYDTVRLIETLPEPNPDPIGIPDAVLIRPTLMAIFDNVKDEITVVTPVRPQKRIAAKTAYSRALDRLNSVVDALDAPLSHGAAPNGALLDVPQAASNTTPKQYEAMVKKAKEYIAAGDIFQVVLSQRFSAPFDLPPFSLYRALRRVNPSPFLYYLNFGGFAVAGSSPEILVRARGGEVTIRPIAGTRRRGATPDEDKRLADELLSDEKERSEHLMLLDLGRNDVGRVAKLGTVRVTDSFFLEYYSQVMHIVSNVVGELSDEHDAVDALMAGFPAGTVSGAPKVRAMEIIDELEKEKRGLYAGCVGYFSATGEMDSCIVLRTSLIKDGTMYVQAGAGIVADSIPASEQRECEVKAMALFRAAEEAVQVCQRGEDGGSSKPSSRQLNPYFKFSSSCRSSPSRMLTRATTARSAISSESMWTGSPTSVPVDVVECRFASRLTELYSRPRISIGEIIYSTPAPTIRPFWRAPVVAMTPGPGGPDNA